MTALHDLALSRERLRLAWSTPTTPNPDSPGSAMGEIAAGLIDSVLSHQGKPGQAGMTGSGMAAVLSVAKDFVRSWLAPIAKERPVQMVLIAALAGGLLVWGRPWQYLQRGAWLRMLLPLLAAKVLANKPKH